MNWTSFFFSLLSSGFLPFVHLFSTPLWLSGEISIYSHSRSNSKDQIKLTHQTFSYRFLENKEEIAKLRKCFAGLWSLDNSEIVTTAIGKPEHFVMKPQREGGGNNIYGHDVKEKLLRPQKEGTEDSAAYILMQRIFPSVSSPAFLARDDNCHKEHAISELGVNSAYLRSKDKVIINDRCGCLMRTKVSSSDEGGVAAGFGVLDSIYLT